VVKVSHARCRRCGQARHRTAKFNLCQRCWEKEKVVQRSKWREIKVRRALKRELEVAVAAGRVICEGSGDMALMAASALPDGFGRGVAHAALPRGRGEQAECPWCKQQVAVNLDGKFARHAIKEAETPLPKPVEEEVTELPRRSALTSEQEQEILKLYTDTDTPLREIAETYGVPETTPFRLLNKFHIAWRRGDRDGGPHSGPKRQLPAHIEAMKDVHVAPPTPRIEPAPEREPAPEVVTEGWRIRVEGTLFLRGTFDEVIAQLRRDHPLLKVRSLEAVE